MQDLKIDLGCGPKAREGYVGVDLNADYAPQFCADIRGPIQGLKAGCAAEVICMHVLEHIPDNGFHRVMLEIARLLKPEGRFEIRVPHPSSDCAMVQGHIHVFTPGWWEQMKRDDWFRGKLVVETIEEVPDPRAVEDGLFKDVPEKKWRYFRNVFVETCVKGHRV